jgi:hypothetical protein
MIKTFLGFYFLNGTVSKLAFMPIETYLVRRRGAVLPAVERHEQNRSIAPVATQHTTYEYKHKYRPVNWFQSLVKTCSNWIFNVPFQWAAPILQTHFGRFAPSTNIFGLLAQGGLRLALNYFTNWTWSGRPTFLALPRTAEKFYENDWTPKTEVVSEELLQSVINPRTTNGHMPLDRLDTNIEQHVMNRVDTSLSHLDYQGEGSVVTSTATVAKFIARQNTGRVTSLGFHTGPRQSSTSTGIVSSNSASAGGQQSQAESNQILGQRYRAWSTTDSARDGPSNGALVFTGWGFLCLTLISGILWGLLLEKSRDLQLLCLFTARAFSRSMAG